MERKNKITRPNNSTGEIYIYRYSRKCKIGETMTYVVRFPKRFKIKIKSFTGDGAYQKAFNWRNCVARNHKIFIQKQNYKYNYSPPEYEKGKKGVVDQCGVNFNGNFEYHVITDDGQRIRKIVDKSQFKKSEWVKSIGVELGVPFTAEMFRQDYPDLLGQRVYVQAKWNSKVKEYRISCCRPDKDAAENASEHKKEITNVIEIIRCDKGKTVQFTPEQQTEIERIVAQRVDEVVREIAERIAPIPVPIKQDKAQ